MTVDPTDKLLVEAVLSRPKRGKDDLEAARLANMRVIKTAVPAGAGDEDEDEDDDDRPRGKKRPARGRDDDDDD